MDEQEVKKIRQLASGLMIYSAQLTEMLHYRQVREQRVGGQGIELWEVWEVVSRRGDSVIKAIQEVQAILNRSAKKDG